MLGALSGARPAILQFSGNPDLDIEGARQIPLALPSRSTRPSAIFAVLCVFALYV